MVPGAAWGVATGATDIAGSTRTLGVLVWAGPGCPGRRRGPERPKGRSAWRWGLTN